VRRLFGLLVSVSVFIAVLASAGWAQSDYPPPTPTAGPAEVVRVPGQAGAGAAARRLPVTGSDYTVTLILIGVAAIVAGLVIVLAVRRHRALARGIA
jgi:LPXTG-motif cell wall-anchored protein